MGPIWGRQDPGGPNVGPMNFAIWDGIRQRENDWDFLAWRIPAGKDMIQNFFIS